ELMQRGKEMCCTGKMIFTWNTSCKYHPGHCNVPNITSALSQLEAAFCLGCFGSDRRPSLLPFF
ncbi:hypothetical protein ILYODFUR_020891, partial [Ilyodon furcidens]